jgi:hypothetical protein
LFLLNAVAAVVMAVALAVRPVGVFALGGMALSAVNLLVFTSAAPPGCWSSPSTKWSMCPSGAVGAGGS